jgi:Ner family transcriptional regulator
MHRNDNTAKAFADVLPARADKRVVERSRIVARLDAAGLTLAQIDRDYGLTEATCRNTMREPNSRGERAIAAALKTYPHLLWPSRYRPNGTRRSPQDWTKLPTFKQRRNDAGQQT